MKRKTSRLLFGAAFVLAMMATSSAQKLAESVQRQLDSAVGRVSGAKLQLSAPRSIRRAPSAFDSSVPNGQSSVKSNSGGLPGVDSVPNFTRAFSSRGQVWPYTMMGNDPGLGRRTQIPTKIIAVSLELQNSDLVTTTKVPIEPFDNLVLNSPNFKESDYTAGDNIQFADAVQRAEFFHAMKNTWHTELRPARIVEHVSIFVPLTTKVPSVDAKGNPIEVDVPTYLTGTADDGSTFVLLLDQFFNQAFFDTVVNAIVAGDATTDALNVVLLPNTFLFSLDGSGTVTAGFHTFFFDGSVTPLPVWVTVFASWISPGLFNGGIQDVTALSHEISESFDNPFLINSVPAWQFPGFPGTCQDNLEVGDPIEALNQLSFPITIKDEGKKFTYHPQTEALLQWFEDAVPSDAIHGAYSYPDTKALTGPAVPFGPLTCSTAP